MGRKNQNNNNNNELMYGEVTFIFQITLGNSRDSVGYPLLSFDSHWNLIALSGACVRQRSSNLVFLSFTTKKQSTVFKSADKFGCLLL